MNGASTWIDLSAAAYASNLALFRRLVGPEVELATVVKANAYGHGMVEIATLAAAHELPHLRTGSFSNKSITRVLVLLTLDQLVILGIKHCSDVFNADL